MEDQVKINQRFEEENKEIMRQIIKLSGVLSEFVQEHVCIDSLIDEEPREQ